MSRQRRRNYTQHSNPEGALILGGCAVAVGWLVGLVITWGLVALVVVGVLKLFGVV